MSERAVSCVGTWLSKGNLDLKGIDHKGKGFCIISKSSELEIILSTAMGRPKLANIVKQLSEESQVHKEKYFPPGQLNRLLSLSPFQNGKSCHSPPEWWWLFPFTSPNSWRVEKTLRDDGFSCNLSYVRSSGRRLSGLSLGCRANSGSAWATHNPLLRIKIKRLGL